VAANTKNLSFSLATPEEISLTLGARLKAQRLAQALGRTELAERAGVHPLTIMNLENRGAATFETMLRVSQALGLTDDLERLFVLQTHSIQDMERADSAQRRRRAPPRKRP
jgi:transcriptional regulator with XRE-family HTH domain